MRVEGWIRKTDDGWIFTTAIPEAMPYRPLTSPEEALRLIGMPAWADVDHNGEIRSHECYEGKEREDRIHRFCDEFFGKRKT